MDDSPQRRTVKLNLLRERNAELERRRDKLHDLSENLDDNIHKIQQMYEAMLASQENQCIDMVAFDEEIKTVNKALLSAPAKIAADVRSREENTNLLMQRIMALQRLAPEACKEQLHADDPLLKRAKDEGAQVIAFLRKYTTFLSG
jgi:arginine deiminase